MNWDAGAVVRVAFIAGREDRAHPAIRLSTLNSDAATNKGEDHPSWQFHANCESIGNCIVSHVHTKFPMDSQFA